MKVNPIYWQEARVSSRSFRLPLIIFLCDTILALAALLNMYSMVTQAKATAEIQYASFLNLYVLVACIEFVMILLIVPALTSGSISGERERQTLNLLLTTRMTPGDIVIGKLMASLSTIFLLIVSSFPVLALVFIYGGVTVKDIVLLLLTFVSTAVLSGSVGICCSSVFKKSTIATVVSYCAMAALVLGTGAGARVAGSSGPSFFSWLLLFNPAMPFGAAMREQLGNVRRLSVLETWAGNWFQRMSAGDWLWISLMVQFLLAGFCLWTAICQVNPRRKRRWKY
ncbi:MAG: ABC transporter permease [Hungatella sp.]|nr:ABC transporter permease [Hungatella sp.]